MKHIRPVSCFIAGIPALLVLGTILLWVMSYRHPFSGTRESEYGDSRHDFENRFTAHLQDGQLSLQWGKSMQPAYRSEIDERATTGPSSHVDYSMEWNDQWDYQLSTEHSFLGFNWKILRERNTYPDIPVVSFGGVKPLVATAVRARLPVWWIALGPSVVILAQLRWAMKNRMKGRGMMLCKNCGYDLRATPNKCPECGATPAAAE